MTHADLTTGRKMAHAVDSGASLRGVAREWGVTPQRAQRLVRLARGLCQRCGLMPHIIGSTHCAGCFGERLADDAWRYKKRKARGVCVRCEAAPEPGRVLCRPCAERNSARLRARRARGGAT